MTLSNTGAEEIRAFVDRIERMEEDKDAILADIKEIYGEAKGAGFTAKILRKVVAERRKDAAERNNENELFDLYWDAANRDLFSDGEVTISAGGKEVKITNGKMRKATAALKTPKGKRALKKIVALAAEEATAEAAMFEPTAEETEFA